MSNVVRLPVVDEFASLRPKTRGDCEVCPTCQQWRDQQRSENPPALLHDRLACGHHIDEAIRRSRPCVFVTCKSNLYSEVRGNLEDANEIPPGRSCVLDLADGGPITFDEIGELFDVTRQRIQQIEAEAFAKVRGERRALRPAKAGERLRTYVEVEGERRINRPCTARDHLAQEPEVDAPAPEGTAAGHASFFEEGPGADDCVCDAIWLMFQKDSNARGFDARSQRSKRVTKIRRARKDQFGLPPWRPRSGLSGDVIAVYKRLHFELGREPRPIEVHRKPELSSKTYSAVQNTLARLRKKGLLDMPERSVKEGEE